MTVALVGIVKNEEANIDRWLESVKPHVQSATLIDTGSEDGTVEAIERHGFQVEHRPWLNFGHNRTEALQLAKGTADYLLVMDADMVLQTDTELPELEDDAYNLTVQDGPGSVYRLPALLRGDVDWSYQGVTHEYLVGADYPQTPAVNLDAWKLHHYCDGSRRPEKFRDDLALLKEAVAADPTDARSVFYLAQTLRDLGQNHAAAVFYEQRISLGGWDEEVWYAHYQKGVCQLREQRWDEGRRTLLAAYLRRPSRAEPLYALAKSMLPPDDLLFIEEQCYGK